MHCCAFQLWCIHKITRAPSGTLVCARSIVLESIDACARKSPADRGTHTTHMTARKLHRFKVAQLFVYASGAVERGAFRNARIASASAAVAIERSRKTTSKLLILKATMAT